MYGYPPVIAPSTAGSGKKTKKPKRVVDDDRKTRNPKSTKPVSSMKQNLSIAELLEGYTLKRKTR